MPTAPNARIEVKAGEFHSTQYLSETQRAEIKRTKLLTGYGEAEYVFRISQTGWYELWVESCSWSTDLRLDGRLLTHTTFTQRRVETGPRYPEGAQPVPGGRRAHAPVRASLATRSALHAPILLRACPGRDRHGPSCAEKGLHGVSARRGVSRCNCRRGDWPRPTISIFPWSIRKQSKLPANGPCRFRPAKGCWRPLLTVATDRAGVFDLHVGDAARAADGSDGAVCGDRYANAVRIYPAKLEKQLVQEIDCARQKPDYDTSATPRCAVAIGRISRVGTPRTLRAAAPG